MRSRLTVGLLLVFCWVAVRADISGVSEWIGFEIDNGLVMIDSEISGIPGRTMIDTGAQINGINSRFLEESGLSYPSTGTIAVVGAFGTANRKVYQSIPVTVFGTEIQFAGLVEFENSRPGLQVILGAGFLKHFVFQFDYPNQRMRVITRDSVNLKKLKNVKSRKSQDGGSPLVKVRLNDEADAWLLFDTGASGAILLDRSFAAKRKWLDRYPSIDGRGVGSNTNASLEFFNLSSMTIGPFELENPRVAVPAEGGEIAIFKREKTTGSRIAKSNRANGILGYDILQHFVVTIDYKAGYVHLEAGSRVEEQAHIQ